MLRTLLAVVAFVALVPDAPAQGRLQRAREETASSDAPAERPRADDEESNLFGDFLSEFLLPLFWEGLTHPAAANEPASSPVAFTDHPYADVAGYLRLATPNGKAWAVRVGVEDGNDFAGLNRLGLRAAFDTASGWGVATNWDHYVERLPCGCRDEFTLGDLMVTYRFVEAEPFQMHVGFGGRGLFDRSTSRGGVNFSSSLDVFPADPLVLSGQAEIGTLGAALTTRLRGSVGVQVRRAEFFLGYDWLRIGGVDLHGPMAGVRLWF